MSEKSADSIILTLGKSSQSSVRMTHYDTDRSIVYSLDNIINFLYRWFYDILVLSVMLNFLIHFFSYPLFFLVLSFFIPPPPPPILSYDITHTLFYTSLQGGTHEGG